MNNVIKFPHKFRKAPDVWEFYMKHKDNPKIKMNVIVQEFIQNASLREVGLFTDLVKYQIQQTLRGFNE